MGVDMQIVYLGFDGSSALEAEAGAQLVRIERFCELIRSCRLVIETLYSNAGPHLYDVRLDLIMHDGTMEPVRRFNSTDPKDAMRKAFAAAEHGLLVRRSDAGRVRRVGHPRRFGARPAGSGTGTS